MTRAEQILLNSPQQTYEWGRVLGRLSLAGDVIALIGDLGAGKTTLTQGIAAGMGIRDEVTSPTYTLIHEYRGPVPLFHLDPYRLDRPEEVYDIGVEEYLDREGVTVIEWADRLEGLLPRERLTLTITNDQEDEKRHIEALATGDRYERLLAALAAEWDANADPETERLT